MSTYIAAYDISENRIRAKLAKFLTGYGARLQKSVFMVNVPKYKYQRFVRDIEKITGPDGDVILIRLCAGCQKNAKQLAQKKEVAYIF